MAGRRAAQSPVAPVSGWVRAVPIIAAFIVGAASFTLSFFAQAEVSTSLGAVPKDLSWLVPITIDGGILAGSASVWANSTRRARKDPVAYLTIVVLLALSVIINVHHAAPDGGVLGAVIAGAPPVVLLLCLELVAAQARRDARDLAAKTTPTIQEASTPAPAPAAVGSTAQPATAPAPGVAAVPGAARPAPDRTPTAAPSLPAPNTRTSPSPASSPVPALTVPVPSAATLSTPSPRSAPTRPDPVTAPSPIALEVAGDPGPVAQTSVSSDRAEVTTTTPTPPTPVDTTQPTQDADAPANHRTTGRARADVADKAPTQPAKDGGGRKSKAAQVRERFAAHIGSGGDPEEASLARTIADELDMPVPSVRRVLAAERKALKVA